MKYKTHILIYTFKKMLPHVMGILAWTALIASVFFFLDIYDGYRTRDVFSHQDIPKSLRVEWKQNEWRALWNFCISMLVSISAYIWWHNKYVKMNWHTKIIYSVWYICASILLLFSIFVMLFPQIPIGQN